MIRTYPVGMSQLAALVSASFLVGGCSATVDGSAAVASDATAASAPPASAPPLTAPPSSDQFGWLTSVLPTSDELSRALGYPVTVREYPPVGDITDLRDTLAGSREVTERQCVGVISSLGQDAYGTADVRAVTYGTESTATFGVVAFASQDVAHMLFTTFAKQWQQCDGTTVVNTYGGYTFEHQITKVQTADNILSAVDVISSDSGSVPVPTERALGATDDCIVEVEVPVDDLSKWSAGDDSAAVALVKSMLERVRTARR